MSVTVKQLRQSGAKGKYLNAAVHELLLYIDEKLLCANREWGRNVVPIELPTIYGFPGLEKCDAQRIIYTAIVRSLQDRGFGVRLLLESDKTILYLQWDIELAANEVTAMNQLIQQVRIAPEEIDNLLARKSKPSTPRKILFSAPNGTH